MIIRSVDHRGLRRLIEDEDPHYLPQDLARRVHHILAALAWAQDIQTLLANVPRGWRVHPLLGDRRNTWSIAVSGNWRITFEIDGNCIYHLNLEDYH